MLTTLRDQLGRSVIDILHKHYSDGTAFAAVTLQLAQSSCALDECLAVGPASAPASRSVGTIRDLAETLRVWEMRARAVLAPFEFEREGDLLQLIPRSRLPSNHALLVAKCGLHCSPLSLDLPGGRRVELVCINRGTSAV